MAAPIRVAWRSGERRRRSQQSVPTRLVKHSLSASQAARGEDQRGAADRRGPLDQDPRRADPSTYRSASCGTRVPMSGPLGEQYEKVHRCLASCRRVSPCRAAAERSLDRWRPWWGPSWRPSPLWRPVPRLRRCGAVVLGATVSILVGLSAGVLLRSAGRRAGASGLHSAASADCAGAGSVLVLLRERAGVLSDRSKLSRTVDPGASEEPVASPMRRALDPTRPLRVRWATAPLRRDAYMFEQDPETETPTAG